jgi:hypothetical protein
VPLGQIRQRAGQQRPRLLAARGVGPGQQLGREHPPALRPRAQQRLIGQLTLIVDRRARLAPPIDLDLRGIEVQCHRRIRPPAQLPVDDVGTLGERPLGGPHMRAPKPPRQLTRRRRRRRFGHRAQLRARLIRAHALQIEHRVPTAQHRLRHRDQRLPRRAPAGALLDRPQTTHARRGLDRGIQRRDQLDPSHQLAHHRAAPERRQRRLIGPDHHPRRLPKPTLPRPLGYPPRTPLGLRPALHRQGAPSTVDHQPTDSTLPSQSDGPSSPTNDELLRNQGQNPPLPNPPSPSRPPPTWSDGTPPTWSPPPRR